MKNKTVLVFGLLLVVLLSFSSGVVLSQTSKELPRLETACETKAGLIHGFNDGFSILKKCSKGSRQVVLGEKSGSTNEAVNMGDIKFLGFLSDAPYVAILDTAGKTYLMDRTTDDLKQDWSLDGSRTLPSEVNVNDIVSWNPYMFLTADGNIWYFQYITDPKWIGPFTYKIE